MGCDIHMHIEVKVDGVWNYYGGPKVSRNYWLFANMAGVRNYWDIKPICEPKGLPDDATEITKIHYGIWDGDAHSTSWLGPAEVVELRKRLQAAKDIEWPENDLEYGILHAYLPENPISIAEGLDATDSFPAEDLRLVFWFDN